MMFSILIVSDTISLLYGAFVIKARTVIELTNGTAANNKQLFSRLQNTQICRALGELETLALLIACLCHDLDHRGTNNSFQIK